MPLPKHLPQFDLSLTLKSRKNVKILIKKMAPHCNPHPFYCKKHNDDNENLAIGLRF